MDGHTPRAPARSPLTREYVEAIALRARAHAGAARLRHPGVPHPVGVDGATTLLVGDFLFVNKFEYGPEDPVHRTSACRASAQPQPGDVIVFQFPEDPRRDYIKRCVAVGGQTVEVRDKQLYVDGVTREEPYAQHIDPTVPPGELRPARQLRAAHGAAGQPVHDGRQPRQLERQPLLGHRSTMDLVKGHAMFIYWSWDGERRWPRFHRILTAIH